MTPPNADAFVLLGRSVPVKGARRSVICDVMARRLRLIPNDLYELLAKNTCVRVNELADSRPAEQARKLREHLAALASEGYGFWTDEPEGFRAIEFPREGSARCTNAIIDIDRGTEHDYDSLFAQLDGLGCEALQIRAFTELPRDTITWIVLLAEKQRFRHLELILKADGDLDSGFVDALCREHRIISRVVVHSSKEASRRIIEPFPIEVVHVQEHLNLSQCGRVDPAAFVVNAWHVGEAQQCNSCLSRKIGIAADGSLKPCPSMSRAFGNTRTDRLGDVMSNPDFQAPGSITKDQVEVCRDCEFRYVCTDCRAHTVDGGLYSKPASCRYNPYTATWE